MEMNRTAVEALVLSALAALAFAFLSPEPAGPLPQGHGPLACLAGAAFHPPDGDFDARLVGGFRVQRVPRPDGRPPFRSRLAEPLPPACSSCQHPV